VFLDPQTHVSPKLDEFAELVPELLGTSVRARSVNEGVSVAPVVYTPGSDGGEHKLVVFSQWETMAFEAAKVLDRLGIGHVVLHGGLAGKDRKDVLGKFQTDPECRVFVSTDAGGTGLNLQTADTVVNLELPWNPAVLEQRIARVHRMGQSRPVRVVNFVTRGTIEENVLHTLERKRGLFAGLFEGDEDAIPFESANRTGFLDGLRELLAERVDSGQWTVDSQERREVRDAARKVATTQSSSLSTVHCPLSTDLWSAAVQLLEAVAALAVAGPIPVELRERIRAAHATLAECLGSAPSR
jgi:superfamily II DNA/RNA helicase